MHDVANELLLHELEKDLRDVPIALQHGKVKMPLGKYLRNQLRRMIGREEGAPEEVLAEYREQLSVVREVAFNSSASFSKTIAEANKGRRASLMAKVKIRKQERKI